MKKLSIVWVMSIISLPISAGSGGKVTAGLVVLTGNARLWYIQNERKNSRNEIIQQHKKAYLHNMSKQAVTEVSNELCDYTPLYYAPQWVQQLIKTAVKDYSSTYMQHKHDAPTQYNNRSASSIIKNKISKEMTPLTTTCAIASGATILTTSFRRVQFIRNIISSCSTGSDVRSVINTPVLFITGSNAINASITDETFNYITSHIRDKVETKTSHFIQQHRTQVAQCIAQAAHNTGKRPYTYVLLKPEQKVSGLYAPFVVIDQKLFDSLFDAYTTSNTNKIYDQDLTISQHVHLVPWRGAHNDTSH